MTQQFNLSSTDYRTRERLREANLRELESLMVAWRLSRPQKERLRIWVSARVRQAFDSGFDTAYLGSNAR